MKFERLKAHQILKYSQTSSPEMIKNLSDKLNTHLRYIVEQDQGVFPFVYGDDIKPEMKEDEIQFVDQTHKFRVSSRFKLLTE